MAAIRSSFRGALVGALIGDCLGAHFEGDMLVPMKDALQHFNAVKTFPRKGLSNLCRDAETPRRTPRQCLPPRRRDVRRDTLNAAETVAETKDSVTLSMPN